jgi:hypothetical protein
MVVIKTDVSEENIASIIRVKRISVLVTLAVTTFYPDDGLDTLIRNVGSYKSHIASEPRRRHSS